MDELEGGLCVGDDGAVVMSAVVEELAELAGVSPPDEDWLLVVEVWA